MRGLAGRRDSVIHRLDARAKLVALVGTTAIAVSAQAHQWPVHVACAAALAITAALARIPPAAIARRAAPILPLVITAAALIPFVRHGGDTHDLGPFTVHDHGLTTLAGLAAKATIGTVSAIVLAATTTFPDLLRGLARLKVPRLLVLIAAFMYRYASVVAGEATRMRSALRARGFAPRHALAAGHTGRVAGALFLRSYARGERVHRAMQSRGYDGTMPTHDEPRLNTRDLAFAAAVLVPLLALRVLV